MPLLRACLATVSRTALFHPCSTVLYGVHPWLTSPASPEINFAFMFSKQSSQQLDVLYSSGGTSKAFLIPMAFAFSMEPCSNDNTFFASSLSRPVQ